MQVRKTLRSPDPGKAKLTFAFLPMRKECEERMSKNIKTNNAVFKKYSRDRKSARDNI